MNALWLLNVEECEPLFDEALSLLPEDRKQKALRYYRHEDQVRSAFGSLLLLLASQGKPIEVLPSGKPVIQGGDQVSLSHSGDYVGLFVGDSPVGFDVERVSRCSLTFVSGAFSPEERGYVTSQERFALAWTLKEAASKCQGDGIDHPSTIGVHLLDEETLEYRGEIYYYHRYADGDYAFALVRKEKSPFPRAETLSPSEVLLRLNEAR